MLKQYDVKNISLGKQGKLNIEYAERHMGALLRVRERFEKEKPFSGITIGMALHVTKETAVLVRTLRAGGATVAIAGCNPLSTQDDVAAALAEEGVSVYAWKGQTTEEYYKNLNAVVQILKSKVESIPRTEQEVLVRGQKSKSITYNLSPKILITIDDGCDLVTLIHKEYPELIPHTIGGCEETTTGIIRLRAMEKDKALRYPMIAVNDNKTKHLMDNYYGTGQSTMDGILRASNVLFAGKTVVVAGYGSCGKGVALRAKGLGANVILCEVDPFRALQAAMDGYRVMPMLDAASVGDIFITVTGNKHVLREEHFQKMKSGALLANSGHFDLEIDLRTLEKMAKEKRSVRPMLDEYQILLHPPLEKGERGGFKSIFVLGEGRLVNLAAAEGHPSEVMSLSFCGQSLACEYLVREGEHLQPSVHVLPEIIDATIASLQTQTMGVVHDQMTDEQKHYSTSWQEGT